MSVARAVGVYATTGVGLGLAFLSVAAGWALFADKPPEGLFPATVIVSGSVALAFCGVLLAAVLGRWTSGWRRAALGSGLGFLALVATYSATVAAGFALGRDGGGFAHPMLLAGLASVALPSALVAATTSKLLPANEP